MNPNALTTAGVAVGTSLAICLILIAFTSLQPGTRLTRYVVLAVAVMGLGFAVHSLGTSVPRWLQVLPANLLLLSGGPILYSGCSAYIRRTSMAIDRPGWLLVAAAVPLLGYWYLIEPNGTARAIVMSAAFALTDGRIAHLLLHHIRSGRRPLPVWLLAASFGSISLWMLVRIVLLASDDSLQPAGRDLDPTTWKALFVYVLSMACITIGSIWAEISPLERRPLREVFRHGIAALFLPVSVKLLLLASAVIVQIVLTLGMISIVYADLYAYQRKTMANSAELANETMASFVTLVMDQVDHVVRSAWQDIAATGSPPRGSRWVEEIDRNGRIILGVRVVDAAGRTVGAWQRTDTAAMIYKVGDGELGEIDLGRALGDLSIGQVQQGDETGSLVLSVQRRMVDPNGTFAGAIIATIDQNALTARSRALSYTRSWQMCVLSTEDRMPRSGAFGVAEPAWSAPLASPLWEMITHTPTGTFDTVDPIVNATRTYVYTRLPGLPLVIVTSFSERDLLAAFEIFMYGVVAISLMLLAFSMIFTLLLAIEAKRRTEQSNFMAMLSHELKTPLAVIRMALDYQRLPERIGARVGRAVADIRDVVERSLQTDRLQHGQILPAFTKCRIPDVLDRLPRDGDASNRLAVTCEPLPVCRTDATLLAIILQNLVDNALKYGRAGEPVRVRASAVAFGSIPGIEIAVSNPPGVAGMPDPTRVFVRYYRAPGAHNRTGSGLGLSNAKDLAHLLQGSLRYVAGDDDVTFVLWLPSRPGSTLTRLKRMLAALLRSD